MTLHLKVVQIARNCCMCID